MISSIEEAVACKYPKVCDLRDKKLVKYLSSLKKGAKSLIKKV